MAEKISMVGLLQCDGKMIVKVLDKGTADARLRTFYCKSEKQPRTFKICSTDRQVTFAYFV